MIPPLMMELERVFRVNHLDAQRPLSAVAYSEWRKAIRVESETVTEVALPPQNLGLRLTTVAGPPGPDGIIEASLTVRSTDWHPVEERLKVQWRDEVREYELSETAYEVMPMAALTIFAENESATAPITPPVAETMRVTTATTLFPPGKPAPTESELRDAEVSALYALHRMRADLGEQIEILLEPPSQGGQVIVRGLVETEERKEQLTEALRGVPLVMTRILTVEEAQRSTTQKSSATAAAAQAARFVGGVVSEQAVVGDRVAQPQAFRTALENYFAASTVASASTAQRVTELTNSSLARSEAALARAWALRRLAENPALSQVERLSPEARTRLAAMLQSHRMALRGEIRSLRGDLDPCLSFVAGGRASGPESSAEVANDWSDAALAVFRSVSRLDRRIHELFSSSGGTNAPAVAARQALADFAETEKSLLILDNQTVRIAADNT
jgi:hypothetical protein